MNRSGIIKVFKEFEKITLYTIHFKSEEHNEFDKFLLKFENDETLKKDFDILMAWFVKITKDLAYERRFRPEKKALAIPIPSCKLRVYCYRISDQLLIIGNGGVKTQKKAQKCPNVAPFFYDMNNVADIVKKRINKGEIRKNGKQIEGNLDFSI